MKMVTKIALEEFCHKYMHIFQNNIYLSAVYIRFEPDILALP